MPKKPLKYKELINILKPLGIEVLANKRGKGSERILLKPTPPGSMTGPQYPIKNHGDGTEISVPVILAIIRRFGLNPDDIWP